MGADLSYAVSLDRDRMRRTGQADFRSVDFRAIRGLVFDAGDVLYDATIWRRWLVQLLARLGLAATYESFFQSWDSDYWQAVCRGQREFSEAFEAFLLAAGLSRSQIDEVEAASQARRRALAADTRPLPGVRSTIARLKETGFRLAILSNAECSSAELATQLTTWGLGKFCDPIVSSLDLERTTPDPACFQFVLKAMSLEAGQVAFVGHDAAELAGARAVGLRTLAFNFERDAVADVYLARFDDLLQLPAEQTKLASGYARSHLN